MSKNAVCYIIAAMPPKELYFAPGERFVIAADAGFLHLKSCGIAPDLCVGDFDSLGFVPDSTEVIRHRPEKDDTDTMLAVREALARGYRKFVFYGAAGGRLDHTYANIQTLLFLAEHGARGLIFDGRFAVTVLREEQLRFDAGKIGVISVFCPDGRAERVNIKGLKYCLSNAVLESAFPLGVSNEFIGERAEVSVKRGDLLVMWEERPKTAIEEIYFGKEN